MEISGDKPLYHGTHPVEKAHDKATAAGTGLQIKLERADDRLAQMKVDTENVLATGKPIGPADYIQKPNS